jgi:hypothetical protein
VPVVGRGQGRCDLLLHLRAGRVGHRHRARRQLAWLRGRLRCGVRCRSQCDAGYGESEMNAERKPN